MKPYKNTCSALNVLYAYLYCNLTQADEVEVKKTKNKESFHFVRVIGWHFLTHEQKNTRINNRKVVQ